MNHALLKVLVITSAISMFGCDKPEDVEKNDMPKPDASTSIMNETDQEGSHKASGTVTAIDRDNSRVVVQMEPVPELNWPADTKPFQVEDKDELAQIEQGDKIEFSFVEEETGQYVAQDLSEQ